jgi:hypothetical protein
MRLRRILVSAKDLPKSLEHANISVDESTICKTLNENGGHGRILRKKPLLSKRIIAARLKFAKEHLDVPHSTTGKIFCGQMKLKLLFGRNTQHYVWRKKAQHTNIKTSSQL